MSVLVFQVNFRCRKMSLGMRKVLTVVFEFGTRKF